MKTPRDILLDEHQGRLPVLDAWRRGALEDVLGLGRELPTSAAAHPLVTAWREMIHPYRRAWAGLATVWVLLLALNCWPGGAATETAAAPPAPLQAFLAFWD